MTKGIWAGLLGIFAVSALSAPLTLEQLKAERGLTWTPGETKVSRLSQAERKQLLGAQLDEGFGDYFAPLHPKRSGKFPKSFDWRNKNGVNYTSPILNQASCGSCVAFAAVATMETQYNITRNTPDSPWAFSPQHLFACGGGGCNTGWQPMSAVSFLQKQGVPDESCFPYVSGADGVDRACSASCSDAASRSNKIVSSSMPTFFFMNEDAVKEALQQGPLIATMMVYEDFLFYKGGVYKHVSGEMAGGHAISIVGWNDDDHAWIVRNSWGEDWGEHGFFRIDYNDASGVGSQTYGMTVSPASGYVTLGGLRDKTVLAGTVSLSLESTISGVQKVEYTMAKKDRTVFWGEGFNRTNVSVDTHQFSDGEYTIQAFANTPSGKAVSQIRRVYVLNGKLDGSLKLNNLTDGQTVTGQTELKISTATAPVPFTKLIFRAKNLATGEENLRVTTTVLPEMKMLWRAQLLKSGDYEISLEGQAGTQAIKTQPIKVKVQGS